MKAPSAADDNFSIRIEWQEPGAEVARMQPIRHNVSCLWQLDWINGSTTLQF
jgi:hypothetical protein